MVVAISVFRFDSLRVWQAEPLLKKVLALRERVLGPNHADVAESLVNLAVLHNKKVSLMPYVPWMGVRALLPKSSSRRGCRMSVFFFFFFFFSPQG